MEWKLVKAQLRSAINIFIIILNITKGATGYEEHRNNPRVSVGSRSVKISEGQQAIFRCGVTHRGEHKVVWMKSDTQQILTFDNRVIVDDRRYDLTHHGGKEYVLTINSVDEGDQGYYMCQMNTDPPLFSEVQLEVVVSPRFVNELTSSEVVVDEGDNATLRCVAHGNPRPNITWQREDGRLISTITSDEVYIYKGSVLSLPSVTRHDAGSFTCLATNGVPSAINRSIRLRVRHDPVVTVARPEVAAYLGEDVTLVCHILAYPPPSVRIWLHNGQMIAPMPGKYQPTVVSKGDKMNFSLTISNVDGNDYGQYECSVSNNVKRSKGNKKGVIYLSKSSRKGLVSDSAASAPDAASSLRQSDQQSGSRENSLHGKRKNKTRLKQEKDPGNSGVCCHSRDVLHVMFVHVLLLYSIHSVLK